MEIDDVEHHELFTNHLKKMRHECDELTKMLESRLENVTKPLCANELNNSSYKALKSETFRAVDAAEGLIRLLYKKLYENLEISFLKLEAGQEERNV